MTTSVTALIIISLGLLGGCSGSGVGIGEDDGIGIQDVDSIGLTGTAFSQLESTTTSHTTVSSDGDIHSIPSNCSNDVQLMITKYGKPTYWDVFTSNVQLTHYTRNSLVWRDSGGYTLAITLTSATFYDSCYIEYDSFQGLNKPTVINTTIKTNVMVDEGATHVIYPDGSSKSFQTP